MTIRPPLELMLGGRRFGVIVSYGYDQPWAMGRFEPDDPAARAQLIALGELHEEMEGWEDCPPAEDEARWRAALDSRGITAEAVSAPEAGAWTIRTADGAEHPIQPPVFDRAGFVTWRW